MAALNALPPDAEPRCTQTVPQMIEMIEVLIKKGHAYAVDGHALFNVPSMPNYGELSRRSRDELVAGARVEIAPYKKDAADFVLWKPSAPDQVGWDSPWGRGRPGWHIECSAMAKQRLGETFDIHGGGLDLIFPHHENEIAQSRCAHDGAPLAKYWMHNGFLTINSDKMSKSLKNFFTVRELLAIAPGEALRLALLSGHYRQPLDFFVEALQTAKTKLDRWYGALKVVMHAQYTPCDPPENFEEALLDDLNTPLAISHIDMLVKHIHSKRVSEGDESLKKQLLSCAQAIGLLQHGPAHWFRWQPASQSGPTEAEIDTQIAARLAARKAKNYAESDRIRDALAAQSVILEDSPGGTTWKRG
jgi:cysteinyl-tRNA synthetase